MNDTPLVANLVANLQQSDILHLASQVASILQPAVKRKRKSKNPLRGLFKHSRSGLWYWRFTHDSRRYLIPLKTTDPEKAQVEALRQKAALYGTPERKTTIEEKNLYIANLQAQQVTKAAQRLPEAKSTFTPEGFIEWYKTFNQAPGRHRETTVRCNVIHIRLLMQELGLTDIRRITAHDLSKWRDCRIRTAVKNAIEKKRDEKAAALRAATSVATIHRNARTAFQQACRSPAEGGAGLLQSNPLGIWKPFSKPERKRLAAQRERFLPPPKLSSAEVRRLLVVADAYSKEANDPSKTAATLCVWLLATAGLRFTEVQFARWEQVDWIHHRLRLQVTEDFTTKSGKSRCIPLPSVTMEKLRSYRQNRGFILPSSDLKKHGLENRFDRVSVRPHIEKILEAAKLPRRITPHGLRHVYVTLCRESGISRDAVQAAVGHSSSIVTAIYDHSEPDAKVFDALPLTSEK